MKREAKQKEMRHEPTQARSAQRVALILDSAAELISEVGYDRATTNDIAKRAGVPIGSLYQYFPNKEALLHALSKRYLSQLHVFFREHSIGESIHLSMEDYLASLIDALIEFRVSHKSFKQMFLGTHVNNELSIIARDMNQEFIKLISTRLENEKPHLSVTRRVLVSYMILGMMRSLFVCMTLVEPEMWEEIKQETKQAMRVYIASIQR